MQSKLNKFKPKTRGEGVWEGSMNEYSNDRGGIFRTLICMSLVPASQLATKTHTEE